MRHTSQAYSSFCLCWRSSLFSSRSGRDSQLRSLPVSPSERRLGACADITQGQKYSVTVTRIRHFERLKVNSGRGSRVSMEIGRMVSHSRGRVNSDHNATLKGIDLSAAPKETSPMDMAARISGGVIAEERWRQMRCRQALRR